MARPFSFDQIQNADLPIQFGRYELQHIQGEGGSARVFRAMLSGPAGFRKPVALKLLKADDRGIIDVEDADDLIREGRLGGRLKHPHIVDVYELGEIEGQLFISMELVDGFTLRRLIATRGRLPGPVAVQIAIAMASGLAKAHSLVAPGNPTGLVHCDIKPSNILISWDGDIKIADFGIATLRNSAVVVLKDGRKAVRGTPTYMSPEQLFGADLDGRSDLFSLAVVICCMVLGRHPFGEMSLKERFRGGVQDVHFLAREDCEEINSVVPGLGKLLLQCLFMDREDRVSDAATLNRALQKLQEGVGYRPRLLTWLKRQVEAEDVITSENGPLPSTQRLPEEISTKRTLLDTRALSNLGPPGDVFVGRRDEFSEIGRLFEGGARLVTIKGTGGAGKTRVARRYARSVLHTVSGGAWFVDLTEVRSMMSLLHSVAEPLKVPLLGAEDEDLLAKRIGVAMASRGRMLVVLDNFEQVVDHAVESVGRWIEMAPNAMFLATSRERLGLGGEHIFPLRPLPEQDGITLFWARARSSGSIWSESDETTEVIAKIVRALDGLPLAIELAAARVRFMSPHQILDRLSERFKLLKGGRRGDSARQATLRGLIDWSWDLLEPWERSALAQLSVFRDGFYMEAAEDVVDLSAWPEAPWSLDVVGSLLDKSLLYAREVDRQPRFDMYVSIQEYAAEKLVELGKESGFDALKRARQRHAAWFARLGVLEHLRVVDCTKSSHDWGELSVELENLISGSRHGTPQMAGRCCIAAMSVVSLKGPVSLGVDLAAEVLKRAGLPPHLRMQLRIGRSRCLRLGGHMKEATAAVLIVKPRPSDAGAKPSRSPLSKKGQVQLLGNRPDLARISLAQAQAIASELGVGGHSALAQMTAELPGLLNTASNEDPEPSPGSGLKENDEETLEILEGARMAELGNIQYQESNYKEAQESYRTALSIYRKHGHRRGEGRVLTDLGSILRIQGEVDQAIEHFQLALQIHKDIGEKRNRGWVLGQLGSAQLQRGHLDEARAQFQLALEAHIEMGDKRGEGAMLGNLGMVYRAQGELDLALEHYQGSIKLEREYGDRRCEAIALGNLGNLLNQLERLDEAQQLFETAISTLDEVGLATGAGAFRGSLALLLARKGQSEDAHRLLESGEPQLGSHPLELGKFLCKKGQVQLLAGQVKAARTSLTQAQAIVSELGVGDHSETGQLLAGLERSLNGERDESTVVSDALASRSDDGEMLDILEGGRLIELGHIQYEESAFDQAKKSYKTALAIYRKAGHRRGEGEALVGVGKVCRREGSPNEAIDNFKLALEIHREIPDRQLEGVALGDLGNVCHQQGKLDEAMKYYKLALKIHREAGARHFEGRVLANLGSLYLNQGSIDQAVEHYLCALKIHREIGARRFEANVLGNLGSAIRLRGDFDEAIEYYQHALRIQKELGDKRSEGVFLGNLGSVLRLQGKYDEAIEHYRLALDINTEIGDQLSEGAFQGELGDALFALGRLDEAQVAFKKAISICDAISYPVGAGASQGSLALLLAGGGQLGKARELLEAGEPQVTPHPVEYAKFLCKKGQVQLIEGQPDAAHASLGQAQAIVKKLDVGQYNEIAQDIAKLEGLLKEEDALTSPDGN